MGYEATMYLLERGVRLTGTDAWSWDAPFSYTAKKVAETRNTALIWEGHKAGRDIGYCPPRSCTTWRRCRRTASRQLLPPQDPWRLGGLDAGGGDPRRLIGDRNER